MTLRHLRSSTADKRPQASGMAEGQLAINTASGSPGLFFKDSAGNLVKVGPVHVGSGAPNASPASGGTAGNSLGEQWLDTSGGTYVFKVWDGAAWRSEAGEFVNTTGDTMTGALGIIAGSASTPGLFFSGDANSGLYSPGADQVAISTGGSGRLFVDASGRIGAGVASPGYPLDLVSQSGESIRIRGTSGTEVSKLLFTSNSAGVDYGWLSSASSYLAFGTAASERMRLTSTGLGVGTSSPSVLLDVYGTGSVLGKFVRNNTGGASGGVTIGNNDRTYTLFGDSSIFQLYDNTAATTRVAVDTSGRVGVGTTSPSTTLDLGSGTLKLRNAPGDSSGLLLYQDTSDISRIYNFYPGSLAFGTNNTERLRIDSSGRVGIGTSTVTGYSSNIVHINGATGSEVHLTTGGTGTTAGDGLTLFTRDSDGAAGLFQRENASLLFGTNDQTRVAITSGGAVGIGTTTVSNGVLHVKSSGISSQAGLAVEASANDSFLSITNNGSAHRLEASYNSTGSYQPISFVINGERARIDTSGRLLVGTSSAPVNGELLRVAKASSGTEGAAINLFGEYSLADDASQTITLPHAALIMVTDQTTGRAGLLFATYDSATITTVSDPSNIIATSDTDTKLCVFKSAGTNNITVKNRLGAARNIGIGKITIL